jgi:Immunity protein 53
MLECNTLARLERWYGTVCDGGWEHQYGISIETLDNPGWMVTIDLQETPVLKIPFSPIILNSQEQNWIACEVLDTGVFRGSGGIGRLDEILRIFLDWAESNANNDSRHSTD